MGARDSQLLAGLRQVHFVRIDMGRIDMGGTSLKTEQAHSSALEEASFVRLSSVKLAQSI